MREAAGKGALGSILFWLVVGIAAGAVSAAFLSRQEYRAAAVITGSVIEHGSPAAGMKQASEKDRAAGEEYLRQYGYRPYGSMATNLIFSCTVHILLFEGVGAVLFYKKSKEKQTRRKRVEDLTCYLQAVNRGEASVLARTEDEFSHLEDEIYKTVMELACAKETAVKEHEVLSERIADIAHQLKTPLTSMSLMTELLEEYQPEEASGYMERLKHQAERLTKLVNGLLTLAKLDSHAITFQKEETEAGELIREAAEPLQELMNRQGITLDIRRKGEEPVIFFTDSHWTGEALLNILKNCMEHTPKKGCIYVSYSKNPLYTEIEVEDGGSGFTKQDLPHLFERFYRGEGAAKDSAGIGLALAKAIVEYQNGHILAENSSLGHARFLIRLYREN